MSMHVIVRSWMLCLSTKLADFAIFAFTLPPPAFRAAMFGFRMHHLVDNLATVRASR